MDIEKLLLAILLSLAFLLVLIGIIMLGMLIVNFITSFLSMEQYFGLIGIIAVLILFICLVSYFYKNVE